MSFPRGGGIGVRRPPGHGVTGVGGHGLSIEKAWRAAYHSHCPGMRLAVEGGPEAEGPAGARAGDQPACSQVGADRREAEAVGSMAAHKQSAAPVACTEWAEPGRRTPGLPRAKAPSSGAVCSKGSA